MTSSSLNPFMTSGVSFLPQSEKLWD